MWFGLSAITELLMSMCWASAIVSRLIVDEFFLLMEVKIDRMSAQCCSCDSGHWMIQHFSVCQHSCGMILASVVKGGDSLPRSCHPTSSAKSRHLHKKSVVVAKVLNPRFVIWNYDCLP